MVRHSYQLIFSRDIDDQRILKTDRTRDTSALTQIKVVLLHATFIQGIIQCS